MKKILTKIKHEDGDYEVYERPVIYVAGAYRNSNLEQVEKNIEKAIGAGRELLVAGWAPLVIHPNVKALWGMKESNTTDPAIDGQVISYNLSLLLKCDAMYVVGEPTTGVKAEIEFCKKRGINVIYENKKWEQ